MFLSVTVAGAAAEKCSHLQWREQQPTEPEMFSMFSSAIEGAAADITRDVLTCDNSIQVASY